MKPEEDPWEAHFKETGHSAGQLNDFYYCTECDWTHGTLDKPGPTC